MDKMIVEALIEIPTGSKNKYEFDKETGRIKLDRVLYSAMYYPAEYGYIENTLAADGDPLDILVITSFPTLPGCLIDARVIGVMEMIDSGEEDVKLIAVCEKDPRFNNIHCLDDLEIHKLDEIKNFFDTYKILQHKKVTTGRFLGIDEAREYYNNALQAYKEKKAL